MRVSLLSVELGGRILRTRVFKLQAAKGGVEIFRCGNFLQIGSSGEVGGGFACVGIFYKWKVAGRVCSWKGGVVFRVVVFPYKLKVAGRWEWLFVCGIFLQNESNMKNKLQNDGTC